MQAIQRNFIRSILAGLLFALMTTTAVVAHAQAPAAQVEAVESHPRRVFSLTWSPLHLTLPIVELTGEVRVLDKLGIAAVLGGGKVTLDDTPTSVGTSVSVYEVGVQGRYYVLGDFRTGMQLGAELIYLHASASSQGTSAAADGVSVGPFVGYKYTADVGFTFDGQVGYQRIGIGGKSSNGDTSSSSDDSVLLNLNVGWSF